jgi:opacity protein-like surface antigen
MRSQRVLVSSLVLSLAIGSVALAQHKPVKANFGVLGGAAFDKPGGPDATDINGTYTGFGVGGFVGIQVTPGFAIEPEVLYIQKGAKETSSSNTGTITGKIKVPYVEFPVLAKLRIPAKGGSIVSPHLYAGPALAFKAGCHAKFSQGSQSISDSCDATSLNIKIKSTDFSLAFGGGVDVGRAIIDVRYDLGLSKLGNDPAPTAQNDVKNRTFYLLAGWTFRAP